MRRLAQPATAAAGRPARRHRRRRTGWGSAHGARPLPARWRALQGRGELLPQEDPAGGGCQALEEVRQPGRRPLGARMATGGLVSLGPHLRVQLPPPRAVAAEAQPESAGEDAGFCRLC